MITTLEYPDRFHVWRSDGGEFDLFKPTLITHGQFHLCGWTQVAPWVFTYSVTDTDGTVYPVSCVLDSSIITYRTVKALMIPIACVEYLR